MEDTSFIPTEITEEDLELEALQRIRNLMWTVSGDYRQDTKIDMSPWSYCREIVLYDAVKQGAFALYFDQNAFALYLVKKIFYGADEEILTRLAQLCIDQAIWKKTSVSRPGVPELRRKAFEGMLEHSFHRLTASQMGNLKLYLMRGYLNDSWVCEQRYQWALDRIRPLEDSTDTMDLIRAVDAIYNQMIDRSFETKHGDLEHVLNTPLVELKEFDWKDFLEEESLEDLLDQYLDEMSNKMNSITEEQDEEDARKHPSRIQKVIQIDEKALAKMHTYMELNYGRSYLTEREQQQIDHRLCRGAHADCSLYYTDGILQNPVISNAQYVNAKRHADHNRLLFRNSQNLIKRSVAHLTDELKRALIFRSEEESMQADFGSIVPSRLWKVGRIEQPGRLFDHIQRRNSSDYVVDILMDASGSQRDRQGLVALQAYIFSEALSNHRIPHRITSFCTFWDYTVMQRFRDYDDPRSQNRRVLDFSTSSNNRDGLAIRAAGDGLLKRQEENKILIILSDGRPNDVIVNRPGSRNPRPYSGEYAVRDTAFEVRQLRNQGIHVLGVFAGKEKDLAAEKIIFGRDFAYIRDIRGFSRTAGQYLRRLLEQDI